MIVKQNRAAGRFAQLALHRVEIITMVDLDVRGEITGRILVWLVTDHHDLGDALGSALARDVTGGDRPVDRLATCHRYRIVVQDLVGDVDVGRDRGANSQNAGVIVGAVAEVGENVLFVGERRLPDPWHAFRTHVGERGGRAIHPNRHDMAADARRRATALGHLGRSVMRAARAEVGHALQSDLGLR